MTSASNGRSGDRQRQQIIDPTIYDLSPELTPDEREALASLVYGDRGRLRMRFHFSGDLRIHLQRLLRPIEDVSTYVHADRITMRHNTATHIFRAVRDLQIPYFAWTDEQWLATLRRSPRAHYYVMHAVAYLVAGKRELHAAFPLFHRREFADLVFGHEQVDASVARVEQELVSCGYGKSGVIMKTRVALCDLMLRNGSAHLEDLTSESVVKFYGGDISKSLRSGTRQLARVLRTMNILPSLPILDSAIGRPRGATPLSRRSPDVPSEWAMWCQRWLETSTLGRATREAYYYDLLKVGRWLADRHPAVTSPVDWTRETAVSWVAAVDRMRVGDWSHAPTAAFQGRIGSPLSARTKAGQATQLRTFFRDCQEWGWISTRFDPTRALATPRSTYALIGPNPRVIADDVWAKLMWAGLNLTVDDLPHNPVSGRTTYPIELVRAITLLWLFTGLRRNEIARLPVGCIRWQSKDGDVAGTQPGDGDVVCLLDVPVHKTGTAFTKPIDRCAGEAVAAWEAVRPRQPRMLDEKTGEMVDFLFAWRGRRVASAFINQTVIAALCKKANVPTTDARGAITSHRARSTIATQLYNAKDPMTLFELQAWLGHRSPSSTQHYAKITPTTLTKAYTDAGYFARNLRTISVLIDRDAVRAGAAGSGEPWQHFDLGHGYCTYDFFEQCPHRMACARCEFYVPKESSAAHLLEAKSNLQRMLVEIPLTDDERAAVEDGQVAVDTLLTRLADVATPAGPTPHGMTAGRPITMLPMCEPAKGRRNCVGSEAD
jgi:integrase